WHRLRLRTALPLRVRARGARPLERDARGNPEPARALLSSRMGRCGAIPAGPIPVEAYAPDPRRPGSRVTRVVLLALAATLALATPKAWAAPRASSPVDEGALADSVRRELLHCWHAYVRYAWGHDEVRPLSKGVRDWYKQPVLMTPVDALDALLIM